MALPSRPTRPTQRAGGKCSFIQVSAISGVVAVALDDTAAGFIHDCGDRTQVVAVLDNALLLAPDDKRDAVDLQSVADFSCGLVGDFDAIAKTTHHKRIAHFLVALAVGAALKKRIAD